MSKPGHDQDSRALLRHTLATLAYRAGKVLREVPGTYPDFQVGPGTRTPRAILAHMGDLFEWALSMARGPIVWRSAEPLPWPQEVERFFAALAAFDDHLASTEALARPPECLFQGPVADALTHTGQLAMLRRLAGAPVKAESYAQADIVVGRVGPRQTVPSREFD